MHDRTEGAEVWAEVAAALRYLREVVRSDLTVWDAVVEGLALWATDDWSAGMVGGKQPWAEPDPLRAQFEMLLRTVADPLLPEGQTVAAVLDAALRLWIDDARSRYNDGRPFASEMVDAVRVVWATDSTIS